MYKPIQTASASINKSPSGLSSSHSVGASLNEQSTSPDSPSMLIDKLESDTLVLFARTDREKEDWFKLFLRSAAKKLQDSIYFSKLNEKKNPFLVEKKRSISNPIISNNINLSSFKVTRSTDFSFSASNKNIIYKLGDEQKEPSISMSTPPPQQEDSPRSSVSNLNQTNTKIETNTQTENGLVYDSSLAFMNTFLIRIFADFFTHQYWISKIQTKMQNKLNTIKLPYFMESLNIINLDLGSVVPLIKQASEPWYDEKGLWVHLDIDYSGGVQILISTKLNLMKLKANKSTSSSDSFQLKKDPQFCFKNDTDQSLLTNLDKNACQTSEVDAQENNDALSDNVSSASDEMNGKR